MAKYFLRPDRGLSFYSFLNLRKILDTALDAERTRGAFTEGENSAQERGRKTSVKIFYVQSPDFR